MHTSMGAGTAINVRLTTGAFEGKIQNCND